MRVVADWSLCEGHSVCETLVPEVFEVGEDDRVHLLEQEVGENAAERVRTAVRRCPKQALSIDAG